MRKDSPQKNTLFKNAHANAKGIFFKRVFFSATQEEFFPPLFFLFFFRHGTGSLRNRTVGASNVNRFVDRFVHNSDRHELRADRRASGNKGLAKVAVQWLIEHLCFVSSAVLADSFVLRNRHLRQAAN